MILWQPIDFEPAPVLASIAELEAYAPRAEIEPGDVDDVLELAEQYIGGYAAWCKSRRAAEILSVPSQDERS